MFNNKSYRGNGAKYGKGLKINERGSKYEHKDVGSLELVFLVKIWVIHPA